MPALDSISSEGEQEVLSLRTSVIEGMESAGAALDVALALRLADDKTAAMALYNTLLPPLALDHKLAALLAMLDEDDGAERFPFLALLPGTSVARHLVAHNVLDVYESTDDLLVFLGRRRGKDQAHQVQMAELRRATAVIYHAWIDLRTLRDQLEEAKNLQLGVDPG